MVIKGLKIKILLLLLAPLGMLFFYITSFFPSFVESFYSQGLNKRFLMILSKATGIAPFSVAEIAVIVLIALAVFFFIRGLKTAETKKTFFVNLILNIAVFISVMYFVFTLSWSINYNRLSFAQITDIDTRPRSVESLVQLCEQLTEKTNSLRKSVNQNPDSVMALAKNTSEVFKIAHLAYDAAAEEYPFLAGSYGKPKGVFLSPLMSYSGITGMYFPFTGEANVNTHIPEFLIPSTVCHEMAHQRGFAREDEANYIAYLTCKFHPDVDFQYSGYMLALINSLNTLYSFDSYSYALLYDKLDSGIKKDLQHSFHYWKSYEGPVKKAATSINDAYLKANGQEDGVYSYGRMVDLLLAEYAADS
jgi:hypothetical protein